MLNIGKVNGRVEQHLQFWLPKW